MTALADPIGDFLVGYLRGDSAPVRRRTFGPRVSGECLACGSHDLDWSLFLTGRPSCRACGEAYAPLPPRAGAVVAGPCEGHGGPCPLNADGYAEDARTRYDGGPGANPDVVLCPDCAQQHHAAWDEQWSAYYSSVMM